MAIDLTVAGPGDAIAFASPAYPPFFESLPRTGARLVHVALHDDGRLDLASLEEALATGVRVLVLASPHNPTGHVSTFGELAAIAERCAEHGVWHVRLNFATSPDHLDQALTRMRAALDATGSAY